MLKSVLLLLLLGSATFLLAQGDPSQKATFALSLRYELGLSEQQINQLDSAEYVFLRDYQLGNSTLKTAEDHQTAYFNYFRPLLKEEQRAKLDEIVRQYEDMLGNRSARQQQQARESLRKRFQDLYLTKAQLDSMYVLLYPVKEEYSEEDAEFQQLSKRKREQKEREKQLEQIKSVLDQTQYNKYLVIRRMEEEEVLKLQAQTIQQTYAPLQLTLEQAMAFFEFEAYERGIDEQGQPLSYWETQQQRADFAEATIEGYPLELFHQKLDQETLEYEAQQVRAASWDQEYLQAAENKLEYQLTHALPRLTKMRLEAAAVTSAPDQKKIEELRKNYREFMEKQAEEVKARHQRFHKHFRDDLLRTEFIQLQLKIVIPSAQEFIQQCDSLQQKELISPLFQSCRDLTAPYQSDFTELNAGLKEFEKEQFVMPANWITTYNYQEKPSEEQKKLSELLSFLLLYPSTEENLTTLKQYQAILQKE